MSRISDRYRSVILRYLMIGCFVFGIITIFLKGLTGCANPNCKAIVPELTNVAVNVCLIAAKNMEQDELGGLTPLEWCRIARNVEPFANQILIDTGCKMEDAGAGDDF